ncbi:hypothetical protein [Helicobacter ganmani]
MSPFVVLLNTSQEDFEATRLHTTLETYSSTNVLDKNVKAK